MKKLVTFLFILMYNISLAQTGWGYVNYTSYKTHNGNGDQSQYSAHVNNAAGFDAMFNIANSNTTISHTGETQIVNLYNGSLAVPHWASDFFGFKFEFWFVPQQTGTYYFGINSDDASDLSVDGVIKVTYYGGHGASSWQTVPINMVAGQRYKMVYRGQEYSGGEAFYFMWYRPNGGWGYWNNEVTNVDIVPTKQAKMNFDFGSSVDETKFAIGSTLSSTGWIDVTGVLDTIKIENVYKPQSVKITTTNTLSTLYNSIITVTDVYLAFKEFNNRGILSNQSGNEFGYGIQYKNADIDDNNIFDESDCFRLLQHLTGVKNIVDTFNLNKTIKLIPQATYNTIGKSNWNTFSSYLGNTYNFNINTGKTIDTFYISATWKGDINLSHSSIPPSNGIANASVVKLGVKSISNTINASIITELNNKVYAYITLDPLQQELVGTQFQLNYDNTVLKFESVEFKTKGNPINYSTNKSNYINLGSLINNGSTTLDNTTEYKVIFTPIINLDNVLGLISIGATDAVNRAGVQLKVKVN